MNQVDRIAGGYDADKIAGNLEVVRANFALNHIESPKTNALRFFNPRSRGSTKPNAENRGVRFRKYLSSHPWYQQIKKSDGHRQIAERYWPAETQNEAEIPRVKRPQTFKKAFTPLAVRVLQEPRGKHRNQSAGQQV